MLLRTLHKSRRHDQHQALFSQRAIRGTVQQQGFDSPMLCSAISDDPKRCGETDARNCTIASRDHN